MILDLRTDSGDSLLLLRIDAIREQELKTLVSRAINTWDTAPQWVKDLNDNLNGNPVISN